MVRACRAEPARSPSVPRSSLSSQASTPLPRIAPIVAAHSTVAVVLCTPPLGLAKATTRGPPKSWRSAATSWSAGLWPAGWNSMLRVEARPVITDEPDLLPRRRVGEGQLVGVQPLPGQAQARGQRRVGAVGQVTQAGMPQRGEMYPDLMRPPGLQPHVDQARRRERLDRVVVRHARSPTGYHPPPFVMG